MTDTEKPSQFATICTPSLNSMTSSYILHSLAVSKYAWMVILPDLPKMYMAYTCCLGIIINSSTFHLYKCIGFNYINLYTYLMDLWCFMLLHILENYFKSFCLSMSDKYLGTCNLGVELAQCFWELQVFQELSKPRRIMEAWLA